LISSDCPAIWVCVYVLPNKVAPITATAAIVKSMLIRLFIMHRTWDSYIIIPIIGHVKV